MAALSDRLFKRLNTRHKFNIYTKKNTFNLHLILTLSNQMMEDRFLLDRGILDGLFDSAGLTCLTNFLEKVVMILSL